MKWKSNTLHCTQHVTICDVKLDLYQSRGSLCKQKKEMPTTIILSYINHLLEKKGQTFIAVVFVFLFQF